MLDKYSCIGWYGNAEPGSSNGYGLTFASRTSPRYRHRYIAYSIYSIDPETANSLRSRRQEQARSRRQEARRRSRISLVSRLRLARVVGLAARGLVRLPVQQLTGW